MEDDNKTMWGWIAGAALSLLGWAKLSKRQEVAKAETETNKAGTEKQEAITVGGLVARLEELSTQLLAQKQDLLVANYNLGRTNETLTQVQNELNEERVRRDHVEADQKEAMAHLQSQLTEVTDQLDQVYEIARRLEAQLDAAGLVPVVRTIPRDEKTGRFKTKG